MKTYIISLFIVAAMLFTGCNSGDKNKNHANKDTHEHVEGDGHDHSAEDGHDHSAEDGHNHEGEALKEEGGHSDEIPFSKQQAEAVGLKVEEVTPTTFSSVIKTSGQILSAQGDEATIVATSNGIVSFTNPSISDGAAVRAGEAILTVSSKNLLEGDPAVKAKITYETAQKEYQRAEELIKEQIISAKEFEQIRLRYETAKISLRSQAANITTSGVRVTSPINGYIKTVWSIRANMFRLDNPLPPFHQNRRLPTACRGFRKLFQSAQKHWQRQFSNLIRQ